MFIIHLGGKQGAGLLGRSDMERNALAALVVAQNEIHGGQSGADGLLLQCSCRSAGCQSQTRPAALPLALNMAAPQKPPKRGININGEKERCPQHHFVWVDPIAGGPARSLDVAKYGRVRALRLFFAPSAPWDAAHAPRGLCICMPAASLRSSSGDMATAKELPCLARRSLASWAAACGELSPCLWRGARSQPCGVHRTHSCPSGAWICLWETSEAKVLSSFRLSLSQYWCVVSGSPGRSTQSL